MVTTPAGRWRPLGQEEKRAVRDLGREVAGAAACGCEASCSCWAGSRPAPRLLPSPWALRLHVGITSLLTLR